MKEIIGYKRYFASEDGHIFSGYCDRFLTERIGTNGYKRVSVHVNKKIRYCSVHRLVCFAFYGEKVGCDVNHKDGNKLNNSINNLEYVSRGENLKHSYRSLGRCPVGAIGVYCENNKTFYKTTKECSKKLFDNCSSLYYNFKGRDVITINGLKLIRVRPMFNQS